MNTQDICEALLSSEHADVKKEALTLLHILNDTDRDYKAKEHPELFFIDNFKEPTFIAIADKYWQVYLIGKKEKYQRYNIININGFSVSHFNISLGEFKHRLYKYAKKTKKAYLPSGQQQRIICIQPDYEKDEIRDDNIFIFNKVEQNGTLFTKSKWSLGEDIYSADVAAYDATAWEILSVIGKDV